MIPLRFQTREHGGHGGPPPPLVGAGVPAGRTLLFIHRLNAHRYKSAVTQWIVPQQRGYIQLTRLCRLFWVNIHFMGVPGKLDGERRGGGQVTLDRSDHPCDPALDLPLGFFMPRGHARMHTPHIGFSM